MTEITLSGPVQQSLDAIRLNSELLADNQRNLATGLKVNSALDDPAAFFTASSLSNRASDLQTLLDDQGQAIQTLRAADEGLEAITNLVEAAKATANQALQTSDIAERNKFERQYNELLTQIEDLARDAGYSGKNLLAGSGNDLTVVFNEDGTSSLSISAVDFTDTSGILGLSDLTLGVASTATVSEADLVAGAENNDTLAFAVGTDSYTLNYGAGTTVADVISQLNAIDGVQASTDGTTVTITAVGGQISLDDTETTGGDLSAIAGTGYAAGSFSTDADINDTLESINGALNTLRSQAATFGTNLTVVENRQDFTNNLITVLQDGRADLVLIDSNEATANTLALQTRLAIGNSTLGINIQQEQAPIRLLS